VIDLVEPVTLSFALRYLISFSKASPLAATVVLSMRKVRRRPARGWPTRTIIHDGALGFGVASCQLLQRALRLSRTDFANARCHCLGDRCASLPRRSCRSLWSTGCRTWGTSGSAWRRNSRARRWRTRPRVLPFAG